MEISEYDQYVPERELDKNFRIPRKRTAEESFGAGATRPYQSVYQDAYAARVLTYSNPPPPPPPTKATNDQGTVPQAPLPLFDSTIKPPVIQQSATNTSNIPKNQYSGYNNMGFIEYPKRTMNANNYTNNQESSGDGSYWRGSRGGANGRGRNRLSNANNDWSQGGGNSFWSGGGKFREGQGMSEKPLGWGNQDSGTDGYWGNYGGDNTYGYNSSNNFNSGNSYNGNNRGRGRGGYNRRDFRNDNSTNQDSFSGGQDTTNKPWKFGNSNSGGRYWNKSEKPKVPKPSMAPITIADKSDESLPKELREMFQPLYCKLCTLEMSSNVMAKMHYVSKNHEKKIRKFLIEHAEKTGEPLHPRATVTAAVKKEKEEDKDPKNFYCEICDLQLTGKQHADSHYMGKSHNAVRMGKKKPAGKGHFDQNGKWVRLNKENKTELPEGEDTFGMDFKQKPAEANPETPNESNPKPSPKTREQFMCTLCSVSCVSQEQLNIHLGGSKHKKKLKLQGISPDCFTEPKEPAAQPEDAFSVTAVSEKDANTPIDDDSLKSKYMTPNGFYYCHLCNITVNSEVQFKQHLDSKNHYKKANAKKTE